MKAIVTGAAGFIGSHLTERLLNDGFKVVGIDCFTDYYPKSIKMGNIDKALKNKNFTLIKKDILEIDLSSIIKGTDYIFHQAAQPGVRKSWGNNFSVYVKDNILATQALLEALVDVKIKKLIFASSSSVYGDAEKYPTKESFTPKPVSPYGVTKLAAENLCYLYAKTRNIPIVSLRYFSVYGPRQRPDMGFNRFINSIAGNKDLIVYGNGKQTRDFTYISDVINANINAMDCRCSPGEAFNIGGGCEISVLDSIKLLEKISGKKAKIRFLASQIGDVLHTAADISRAKHVMDYKPKIKIEAGLEKEYEWLQSQK